MCHSISVESIVLKYPTAVHFLDQYQSPAERCILGFSQVKAIYNTSTSLKAANVPDVDASCFDSWIKQSESLELKQVDNSAGLRTFPWNQHWKRDWQGEGRKRNFTRKVNQTVRMLCTGVWECVWKCACFNEKEMGGWAWTEAGLLSVASVPRLSRN